MCLRVVSTAKLHGITNQRTAVRMLTAVTASSVRQLLKHSTKQSNEAFVELTFVVSSVPAPSQHDLTYFVTSLTQPRFMWVE